MHTFHSKVVSWTLKGVHISLLTPSPQTGCTCTKLSSKRTTLHMCQKATPFLGGG
jgi:hypothetical protein